MTEAVLFDMGGTLDGDGTHWLDRFAHLYAAAGLDLTRERIRAAFDEAERQAAGDQEIAHASLKEMVDRHVTWQFAYLGIDSDAARTGIAGTFVDDVRRAAQDNVDVLAKLKAMGLTLGVVSNGCGNVEVLCTDLGYAGYLSVIVDSRRVRLFKPDPAIYAYAADRLGLPPADIMMVGDSFDRDVRPARSIGMKTAWLQGTSGRRCPDPGGVDVQLRTLSELPATLGWEVRTTA